MTIPILTMQISRTTKVITSVLALILILVVAAIVVLVNYDWNRAKPWLNAHTSEALGRPFEIAGDLSLTWKKSSSGLAKYDEGWRQAIPWPHLLANDIRIGNPADFERSQAALSGAPTKASQTSETASASSQSMPVQFASIKRIGFSINPFSLLNQTISVPLLLLDTPTVTLLRNKNAANNWSFPATKGNEQATSWQLDLQHVALSKGSVHLVDAIKQADALATIETIAPTQSTNPSAPNYGIEWKLSGKFNNEPLSGAGQAGGVLSLQQQLQPYPLTANVQVGTTKIAVTGTITKPTDLAALDMRLKMSGVSMGRLYALTGVFLPETPPFSTEGHLAANLNGKSSHWLYDQFTGKVGNSDIGGSLTFDANPAKLVRPVLAGKIVSRALYFADLAPVIGADSKASKLERGADVTQPADRVLPIEPFKSARWTSIDANVEFSADKIVRDKALPINQLTTHVFLKDGVMSLQPLNFVMAGGQLNSNIVLDGNGGVGKNAIKATMKISAEHLKLKQLFPTLPLLQASIGEINGEASLSAVGNSVASLLGASNGEIKTLIDRGTISKLLLEEMGLNVGNIVISRVFGDKQVNLNCMATDFIVTNGVMQSRLFIIDTDDAVLNLSGDINLANEQLDLTIRPNSKGVRVISLRSPLYVKGTFKQPDVSVDKGVLAAKAGSALALGIVAPFAALLPLVNTGPNQDNACAALLADARKKPVAPAPGTVMSDKKMHAK